MAAAFAALSAEDGPWLETFGVAVTGTAFSGSAGVAIIDGPVATEEFDDANRTRAVDVITATCSAAGLASSPLKGKTIIHGALTFIVRAEEQADEGMKTLRASRQRTPQTGRQAEG